MGIRGRTPNQHSSFAGFTIVELLIVVVVIAILAAITIVSYNGITQRATVTALQADLRNAHTKLSLTKALDGIYPNPTLPDDIKTSNGNTFQYTSNGNTYCLTGLSANAVYRYNITDAGVIAEGMCSGHSAGVEAGAMIQTVTEASCPAGRVRVVDARDNHTYWVQKLADGRCWMLTNLGYQGGGTNTYSDVQSLTNGTGGSLTFTLPSYYVVPSTTNFTTEPTNPSTSTDGTGQYGYLYNWCAAMGGQPQACQNGTGVGFTTASICPAGWRLPTANTGDFGALNTAVNGGLTNTDAGLRTEWLGQRGGLWASGFGSQGSYGYYWSSSQSTASAAYTFVYRSVNTNAASSQGKVNAFAVRCIAN